jgi:hypothetical protein
MASIKTLLGTDSIKTSRLTLNENFAALNQELTEISELLVDFENSNGGSFNGTVTTHIIPNQTETYDLGSPTQRFRDIYLSNNTIYLGLNSISMSNGNMLVNGNSLATNARLLEEVAERARLLGIETTSRNQAISSISNQVSSLANETESIAGTLTNLNTSFEAEIAAAVGAETLARTTAISGINQALTTLSDANEATSQLITDLSSSFNTEITDAIEDEISTITNAISGINETLTTLSDDSEAISQSITDLSSSFTSEISAETLARTTAISGINETLTTLNTANEATTQSITDLSSSFTSEISAETLARTTAISDINETLTTLSDANEATAQLVTDLNTTFTTEISDAISGINETLTTLSDANEATAQSVTDLSSSFISEISTETLARTTAIAGVVSSISAVTTANEAIVESVTNLGTQFETELTNAITTINEEIASLGNGDGSTVTRLNTLEAQYTIADGSITGFSESSALKTVIDSAIATANEATITSTTDLIAELEDQTAEVTQTMTASIDAITNKINAQYTLEVDANGNVAGMKLGADENGSEIAFTADAFKVSTGGPQGQLLTPFSIINGQVAFNGAVSFSENPSGPQGPAGTNGQTSYFHIAYADNATGTIGFSTTVALGKLYLGTYTDFTEADSTDPARYTWILIKGVDGVDGADGRDGSDGVGARAVNLTCEDQVFRFNAVGFNPFPTDTIVTAEALNTEGTVYYEFFKNDVSVQNTESLSYTYTPPSDYLNMPDKIEVQIREGGTSGTVLARDQITLFGVKPGIDGTSGRDGVNGVPGRDGIDGLRGIDGLDGTDGSNGVDGITVILSNEAHTLPTTNLDVVTYTGSGTTIKVYEGSRPLIYNGDGNTPLTWTVVSSGSSITPGSTTDSGTFATIGNHSNMTSNTASITYTITGTRDNGESFSFIKEQSFAKSIQGANGVNGINGINGTNGLPGANGTSSYFHVAYADNASGGGFSQSGTGKIYIGTYVDTTQADAAAGSSLWKWQLVKGADGTNGANGIAGTNGADGRTSYLHIAYANNTTGTSGFSTTDPTGRLFLGTYTDFTEADSTNPALYTWTLVKGSDGANGTNGSNGSPGAKGDKGDKGDTGPQGPAPDTSTYLTTSTSINGGQITTGTIKNGNFPSNHTSAWNTYSSAGMGINLDQGAINAKNFYIDPAGNAKFRGDIDLASGATVGGSPLNDFFQIDGVLKMRDDAYIGGTRFSNFRDNVDTLGYNYSSFRSEYNTFANNVATRFEDIDPYGPGGEQLYPQPTTLSHQYIKRNDVILEIGDLVKLDENNELVKASSVKDTAIVGILWKEVDFTIKSSPLDQYLTEEKDTSEKDYQYRDSFGNKIPLADRDQKTVWRVASLGDSVDVNSGLQGIKVCNQNGPVLKGDLLCSSDVPGYAMKQPVEYAIIGFDNDVPQYEERQTVNSYTLGKCMENCTFDSDGKATGIYGYLYCG